MISPIDSMRANGRIFDVILFFFEQFVSTGKKKLSSAFLFLRFFFAREGESLIDLDQFMIPGRRERG